MKPDRFSPPTLKDVAREAGVSAQTISNYLTGRTQPRGKNLERIQQAIHKLNYRPSAAARALRLRQSNILGMIFEDVVDKNQASLREGWEPLHTLFLQGATMKAREHDFYVTTVLAWHGEAEDHAAHLVREGRADGLIFSSEAMTPEQLARIQNVAATERAPLVLLQENTRSEGCCAVYAEDEVGGEKAARHFWDLGHRTVAVATVKPDWPGPIRRARAFKEAAERLEMRVTEWAADAYTIDAVRSCVRAALSENDRPSAVFAVNDIVAVAIIQQATELGVSVPGKLSVIGFNDLEIASYFRPAITTIKTPAKEMGARAAEVLIEALRGRPLEDAVVLPVEFIERESTARAPS